MRFLFLMSRRSRRTRSISVDVSLSSDTPEICVGSGLYSRKRAIRVRDEVEAWAAWNTNVSFIVHEGSVSLSSSPYTSIASDADSSINLDFSLNVLSKLVSLPVHSQYA